MDTTGEDLGAVLRQGARLFDVSDLEFATLLDINRSTLYRIENHKHRRRPNKGTLLAVRKGVVSALERRVYARMLRQVDADDYLLRFDTAVAAIYSDWAKTLRALQAQDSPGPSDFPSPFSRGGEDGLLEWVRALLMQLQHETQTSESAIRTLLVLVDQGKTLLAQTELALTKLLAEEGANPAPPG